MKKFFQYTLVACLMLMVGASCEDNENWRVIPYEPAPSTEAAVLYVVGNHQGWAPAAEVIGKIYSVDNDGVYSGYVYLDGEFKCTIAQDWDHGDYGQAKEGAEGQLASSEEGNENMTAEAGYYMLTLDTNAKTYSIEPRNWGVIGDATPGGWNEDTDLVYDPADLKLKVDMTLIDGTIKFRSNDAWDPNPNFGGTLEELVPGGDNIPVTAGTYQVVLDLSTPDYKAELIAK